MMCICGQESTTTHACTVYAQPLCSCGHPANQTHAHPSLPLASFLVWPWYHFVPRPWPGPAALPGKER